MSPGAGKEALGMPGIEGLEVTLHERNIKTIFLLQVFSEFYTYQTAAPQVIPATSHPHPNPKADC